MVWIQGLFKTVYKDNYFFPLLQGLNDPLCRLGKKPDPHGPLIDRHYIFQGLIVYGEDNFHLGVRGKTEMGEADKGFDSAADFDHLEKHGAVGLSRGVLKAGGVESSVTSLDGVDLPRTGG